MQVRGGDGVQIVISHILAVTCIPHIEPPDVACVVKQIDHFTVGLHSSCVVVLVGHPFGAANCHANKGLGASGRHGVVGGMHGVLGL